ncbi:alpha-ketoacid dehydrogenase subunit beta [Candidatus Bathyarchaeota archaeon]|nr:MAG: alpha-ketoacid dehydrogenase subunit beta [Candidatus Bathyarchaeota archaeon]
MSEKIINVGEAIHDALVEEMRRDPSVVILGESIQRAASFGITRGLLTEFGYNRVWDTPIAENAIAGLALGAALTGLRPVPIIMIGDFLPYAMEIICNEIAKYRYMFGGNFKVPITIRVGAQGAGAGLAAQHSQCLEAWFIHVPGLKVVYASTPYDAKGLLKASIRDDNPVLFFEHKFLGSITGTVPTEDYTVPIGVADVKREGEDLTIVAWAFMMHKALNAATELEKEGISVEVVDPRTLYPMDKETILQSVKKTGRLIIAEEAPKTGSIGAEISAMVNEEGFDYLDAPIMRVAAPHTPIPYSAALEKLWIPNVEDIINMAKKIVT